MDFIVIGLQLVVLYFQTFGIGFKLRGKLEEILKEKLNETEKHFATELDKVKSALNASVESRLTAIRIEFEQEIGRKVSDAQEQAALRRKQAALRAAEQEYKKALKAAEEALKKSKSQSSSADQSTPSDTDSPR